MAAVTQIRHKHSQGRAYYQRKLAEGKTHKEALRALKRRISDAIYAALVADARQAAAATSPRGPGRATGEPLCLQGGRLTPRAPALRASYSRACHHPTARHRRRSRPHPAEPSASPPTRPLPGRRKETPHTHLTPTAKRTRSGRVALWPAQERGGAAVVAAGDEGRGTVTGISSACGRQTYALSPGGSASLTSARFGQRPACHRRLGNRAHSAKLTSQPGIGRAAGKERGSSI